jgi:hypothetical protein
VALRPATQLFIADHGQYRTQPLIVADGAVSVQCRGLDFMRRGELSAPIPSGNIFSNPQTKVEMWFGTRPQGGRVLFDALHFVVAFL